MVEVPTSEESESTDTDADDSQSSTAVSTPSVYLFMSMVLTMYDSSALQVESVSSSEEPAVVPAEPESTASESANSQLTTEEEEEDLVSLASDLLEPAMDEPAQTDGASAEQIDDALAVGAPLARRQCGHFCMVEIPSESEEPIDISDAL